MREAIESSENQERWCMEVLSKLPSVEGQLVHWLEQTAKEGVSRSNWLSANGVKVRVHYQKELIGNQWIPALVISELCAPDRYIRTGGLKWFLAVATGCNPWEALVLKSVSKADLVRLLMEEGFSANPQNKEDYYLLK